jgi:hypothetical protein
LTSPPTASPLTPPQLAALQAVSPRPAAPSDPTTVASTRPPVPAAPAPNGRGRLLDITV